MRALLLLMLCAGLAAAVASGPGGLQQAAQARLQDGALQLGGQRLAWAQLAWFQRDAEDRPLQPQAVITAAGERYAGQILGWDGQTLRFAADPGASLELPAAELAALLFQPRTRQQPPAQLPALLRGDGAPVAGDLKRLAADRIELGSPLGELAFASAQAEAYLWRPAALPQQDQLLLRGGARLHGALRIEGERLRLEHPRLGRLELPLAAVQEIRRVRPGLRWLAQGYELHRQQGALGEVAAPQPLDPHDPAAGLRLIAESVLSWPATAGRVSMRVRALDGRVGLVAAVDKQSVAKLALEPGESALWSFELPAGSRLLLACRGLEPRPVAVELHAPHLLEAAR